MNSRPELQKRRSISCAYGVLVTICSLARTAIPTTSHQLMTR